MTETAPKPTSLRAIRDAIQKVAVALVAANDGKPHVIHPQITAEAVAALALLERIILDERPQQSAEPVAQGESKVAKVLRESIERVRPLILAEREGETITGEVMNMILSGSECPCCYGKGKIPEETPNATVAYLIGLTRSQAAFPGPSELVEEMEKRFSTWDGWAYSDSQMVGGDHNSRHVDAGYKQAVTDIKEDLRALITRHRGKSCAHDRKHAQFQSSAPMVLIESPDYAEYLRTHPSQVPSQETQAAKFRELEKEFRETAETLAGTASAAGVLACADRLSAIVKEYSK